MSQFKVLAAGSGADSEQLSLQHMERLMTLHALAEHCVGLSNEALRQEIESYYQQVHTSPLGECTEALILKVLACLREFAYRAVPGQRGKGLFANTAQMLAVCDVVCNKGNLGIQLATGEGKTLVIALCSAMQALTSQQGVDLLTANQTLARRDCAQFYDFYAVCGIQTRLLSADSATKHYLRAPRTINITDVSSMALFQAKERYQNKKGFTTLNPAYVDERDDVELDNKICFNYAVPLQGDVDAGAAALEEDILLYEGFVDLVKGERGDRLQLLAASRAGGGSHPVSYRAMSRVKSQSISA